MKRHCKLVMALSTAVIAIGSLSAEPICYKRSFGITTDGDKLKRMIKNQFPVPLLHFPNTKKTDVKGEHKLTIKLNAEDEYASTDGSTFVYIQNKDMKESAIVQPGETETVLDNFSSGIYDIFTIFSVHGNPKHTNRFVVKENVTVDSDTEVTLSSDDATVKLQFDYKNIKGEDVTLDEAEVSEDGQQVTVTQNGNSRRLDVKTQIRPKGYSGGYIFNNTATMDTYADFDIKRATDLYISPLSDRWMIANTCVVLDNDNAIYIVKYRQDGTSESKQIVNDPAKFITCEESFLQSPMGKSTGKQMRFGRGILDITDEFISGVDLSTGMEMPSDGITRFYVDAPDDSESKDPAWNIRLQPVFVDFENVDYNQYALDAVPVNFTKGVDYEVVGDLYSEFNYDEAPFYIAGAYKPHKAFSYTSSQKASEFGGNTPIAILEQYSYENEEGYKTLGFDRFDPNWWYIPASVAYMRETLFGFGIYGIQSKVQWKGNFERL